MLRALFCVLVAFFRAAAALRQVLIFQKIQNLEDDHMGFHYAREKKKFDAEWAKTAAWYKAEGMSDEDIEAMRRFDWAEFCSRRAYENRTQPLPEETIEADSASTLFQKFEQLTTSLDAETFSGRSDWIEQIEDGALAGRLKQLSPADLELLTLLIVDGLSQTEIASRYHVSRQTINEKIMRIKKFLKIF